VAAGRLGCAHGTILSRLARARGRLRRSLIRRGRLEFAGPVARGWFPSERMVPLPAGLVKSTVQAAVQGASVRTASGAILSSSVIALTHATLRTLFMTRMTLGVALLATAAVCTATTVSFLPFAARGGSFALAAATSAPQNHAEKLAPDEQKGLRPQEIKDALYRILRRDHALRDPRWPFLITVRDVEGDTLVDATFRHRTKGDSREFDLVLQAKRAVLHVDLTGKAVYAILEEPEHQGTAPIDSRDVQLLEQVLKIPVPPGNPFGTQESKPVNAALSPQQQADLAAECLRRVKDTHGTENVWAVAGYRIGARALKELRLPRHAESLLVIHRFPNETYAVMADGLQAATGASAGKRNLRLEETVQANMFTLIEDRNTGRRLRFSLRIEFVKSFLGAPLEFLVTEAKRIAALPDDAIFEVRTD
jgi:formylmethanofuran dehydrogenase subunit E